MFQLSLFDDKEYEEGKFVEIISIRFINSKEETSLYLRNSMDEEMITKFVLNEVLYQVGMLWII